MKLKFNTSRELKILLGVGLLALGVYLWLNFLSQGSSSFLPSFLGGGSSSSTSQIITSPRTTSPRVVSGSNVVTPLANNPQAVTTVNTNPNNSVATTAREIIIVDLPFLVTEAPVEDLLATDVSEETIAQNRALRATVNPFSPIIIEEDKDRRNISASTSVQTVNGTSRPTSSSGTRVGPGSSSSGITNANSFKTPTTLIESAPLRTVTPAPALANNLPRTLATGTLNVTPGILRNQNTVPPLASEVEAAKKAAEGAEALRSAQIEQETRANKPLPVLNNTTIRMPQSNGTNLPTVGVATTTAIANSNALPNILATGRNAQNIPITVTDEQNINNQTLANDTQNALADPTINGGPLEVGGSDLSRYLRDNNFQYTGSVRGVVSVGMFRTSAQAITITLGQTIPQTDIVLTDLQNNQAEFTQGQDKVILNLDLRR